MSEIKKSFYKFTSVMLLVAMIFTGTFTGITPVHAETEEPLITYTIVGDTGCHMEDQSQHTGYVYWVENEPVHVDFNSVENHGVASVFKDEITRIAKAAGIESDMYDSPTLYPGYMQKDGVLLEGSPSPFKYQITYNDGTIYNLGWHDDENSRAQVEKLRKEGGRLLTIYSDDPFGWNEGDCRMDENYNFIYDTDAVTGIHVTYKNKPVDSENPVVSKEGETLAMKYTLDVPPKSTVSRNFKWTVSPEGSATVKDNGGNLEIKGIKKGICTVKGSMTNTLGRKVETTFEINFKDKNAKQNIVYLSSMSGNDSNDGATENTSVKTFEKAKSLLAKNGKIYVNDYTLNDGEVLSLPEETYGNAVVTRVLDSSYSWDSSMFYIGDADVTFKDITIDGGADKMKEYSIESGDSLINIDSVNANITFDDGCVIQNCPNYNLYGFGGAVATVNNGSTITMNEGSLIQNCYADCTYEDENASGGAITVYDGGKFIMNGGEIRNCTARKNKGGAIYALTNEGSNPAEIILNKGKFSGNSAVEGGAIYKDAKSEMTIGSDVIFENNKSNKVLSDITMEITDDSEPVKVNKALTSDIIINCKTLLKDLIGKTVIKGTDNYELTGSDVSKIKYEDETEFDFNLKDNQIVLAETLTGIKLDKEQLVLNVADNETIIASPLPENATLNNLKWKSSDNDVISVKDGVLTALKPGKSVITAEIIEAGKSADCTVYVKEEKPEAEADRIVIKNLKPGAEYIISGENITADSMGEIAINDKWRGNNIEIIKKGKEELCNSDPQSLTINNKIDINTLKDNVTLEYTKTIYDGNAKEPEISLEYEGEKATFDIEYKDNTEPGTAKAILRGNGIFTGEITLDFIIEPIAPADLKLSLGKYQGGYDDVKLTWNKSHGADYYNIYTRRPSKTKEWTYAGKSATTSFTKKDLVDGYKYEFLIKPVTESGNNKITGKGTIKSIVTGINLKAPATVNSRLGAYTGGFDDIYATWSKVNKASGYYVYYRRPAKTDKWTLLERTTKNSVLKKNLQKGYKYNIKIVPYYERDNYKYKSTSYKIVSVTTLKAVNKPSVRKFNSSKVKISWKTIAGKPGYQVMAKRKGKTTYFNTTGNSINIKVAKNKNYTYKVRAYKNVKKNGKLIKVYGPWSQAGSYKLR